VKYEVYIIVDKKVQLWMVADEATAEMDISWAETAGLPAVAVERDSKGEICGFAITSACASLHEVLRQYMLDM
jgi:hypothetical protein